MPKKFKQIPKFKNEDEEREFWATADSTEYFDWSKAKRVVFSNLKRTKKPISLRISTSLLSQVKSIANKKDIPYQSLIKQYIAEAVERETGLDNSKKHLAVRERNDVKYTTVTPDFIKRLERVNKRYGPALKKLAKL